mmetsp:Transcript_10180/g.31136  ORF Transcript_10180/g.31136 Transcript_10180/m.31136 type:complete len:320 (-) Transcript_10180:2269-3228(-)
MMSAEPEVRDSEIGTERESGGVAEGVSVVEIEADHGVDEAPVGGEEMARIESDAGRDLEAEVREHIDETPLHEKGVASRKKRFVFNAKADIILLREVLTERPFDKEYGRMREAWKTVASKLLEYQILVDDRGARDRYCFLLKVFNTKDRQILRRLGTEEEYETKERLLAVLSEQVREAKKARTEEQKSIDGCEAHLTGLKRAADSDEDSLNPSQRKRERSSDVLQEFKAEFVRLETQRQAAEKERLAAEFAERELDRKERQEERLLRERQLNFEMQRFEQDMHERIEQRKADEKKFNMLFELFQTNMKSLRHERDDADV